MVNSKVSFNNLGVFDSCPQEILSDIKELSQILSLKPKQTLVKNGDPIQSVYVVLYGTLKLMGPSVNDKEVLFQFFTRGDTLGASLDFESNQKYSGDATAVDDVGVLCIPIHIFKFLIKRNPPTTIFIWRQLNRQLLELQKDRENLRLPISLRLAEFLIRMLNQQQIKNNKRIMIKLSRKDLAAKIGTEPGTIVRILSKWQKNGWIRTENKFIDIIAKDSLEKLFILPSTKNDVSDLTL